MTQTAGDGFPPLAVCAKRRRKEKGQMTMKERLKVHAEIERENARRVKEWKEGGANHETAGAENKESA